VRKCCGAVSARRGLRAPRVGLEAGEKPYAKCCGGNLDPSKKNGPLA
jgi:hypothetical protein